MKERKRLLLIIVLICNYSFPQAQNQPLPILKRHGISTQGSYSSPKKNQINSHLLAQLDTFFEQKNDSLIVLNSPYATDKINLKNQQLASIKQEQKIKLIYQFFGFTMLLGLLSYYLIQRNFKVSKKKKETEQLLLQKQITNYKTRLKKLENFNSVNQNEISAFTHRYERIKEDIENISQKIGLLSSEESIVSKDQIVFEVYKKFNQIKKEDALDWQQFEDLFRRYFPNFETEINKLGITSKTHIKNIICLRMDLRIEDSAILLNTTPSAIKQSRYRIKKLILPRDTGISLEEYIHSLDLE